MVTSQKNTKWRSDSTGAYIEFEKNSTNLDISVNFENLLNTGEYIEAMTVNSDVTVANMVHFGWMPPQKDWYWQ